MEGKEKSQIIHVAPNTIARIFYDEEGNETRRITFQYHHQTDIEVSRTHEPKTYARLYYRRVRRFSDGRDPKKFRVD